LVERFALVEAQGRAHQHDGFGAALGKLRRRRADAIDYSFVALGRHGRETEALDDELDIGAVHRDALFGHTAPGWREEQAKLSDCRRASGARERERRDGSGAEQVASRQRHGPPFRHPSLETKRAACSGPP
jgi:hypothetical protein